MAAGSTSPPRSRNLAATLWGWVFALTLPLTLLAGETARLISDPLSLAPALTRQVTQGDLLPAALAWLTEPTADGKPNPWLRSLAPGRSALLDLAGSLDQEGWRQILAELLPPELPGTWISDTLGVIPEWLEGGPAIPEVRYDLRPLRARALSNHGLAALQIAFDSLPACDPASVQRWASSHLATPSLPGGGVCSLPEPQREEQFYGYAAAIPVAVADLRGGFTLQEAVNPTASEEVDWYFLTARWWLRRVQLAGRLAPLFSAILLLGILLLTVRSWTDLARAWTPWLAGGGVLTAGIAVALGDGLRRGLLAAGVASVVSAELMTSLTSAARTLIGVLSTPLLVRGATSALLAAALWWHARRVRRRTAGPDSARLAESVTDLPGDGELPSTLAP